MKLDSSTAAVVTGGASGLGAATVKALRDLGVRVAIFDKNPETGQAKAAELGALFCEVDVMSEDSVDAGFAKARAAHGQERCLVNCAGGGRGGKTIARDKQTGEIKPFNVADFEWVLGLNTVGTFRCIVKSAAGMASLEPNEDGERGAIVNTGSVAAEDGQVGQVAYAAAKAAIKGMTLVIARDLSNGASASTPSCRGSWPRRRCWACRPAPRRSSRASRNPSRSRAASATRTNTPTSPSPCLRNGYFNARRSAWTARYGCRRDRRSRSASSLRDRRSARCGSRGRGRRRRSRRRPRRSRSR